ncbi:4-oxalocrotonate tautomerase [Azotobacter vinelandii CA]|uniref:2-hydroxymuconate tautomerase n=2 Tax=Azotobacter vinelandii TaxID=354 RepID=C1DMU0_AZOVD|nr:2-hydroxymuconate tautomerase [Azotobacter vinelandii]ACO77120.1 4-oxalocrotonate tautomerase [Azotobacter vinelandii DJ]AGK13397.1 4-oxalocrotonate tautomerase [Azotobacter vinelandii CA]AGK17768.1 4-oxalocrotonate tautomerase [Azotobacter vinelandii CA6]WKN22844.1 2-hydroxymuconate tautomerase family protein [Azotobacter vinelandii]SFY15426.1 4-oxalocrotonate tautomerase [Azotobacter vinelandii]
MPIMQIHLIEGRSEEQKARLIEGLTRAAVDALDAPVESIRVIISEVPNTDFGIAGQTAKQRGR